MNVPDSNAISRCGWHQLPETEQTVELSGSMLGTLPCMLGTLPWGLVLSLLSGQLDAAVLFYSEAAHTLRLFTPIRGTYIEDGSPPAPYCACTRTSLLLRAGVYRSQAAHPATPRGGARRSAPPAPVEPGADAEPCNGWQLVQPHRRPVPVAAVGAEQCQTGFDYVLGVTLLLIKFLKVRHSVCP